jgi:hypothetical protein
MYTDKFLADEAYNVLVDLIHLQVRYSECQHDLFNFLRLVNPILFNPRQLDKMTILYELSNKSIEYIINIKEISKSKHFQTLEVNINNLKQIIIDENRTLLEFATELHETDFFLEEANELLIKLLNKYKQKSDDILRFPENEEFKKIVKYIQDNYESNRSEDNSIMFILINAIPYVYIFEVLNILKYIKEK